MGGTLHFVRERVTEPIACLELFKELGLTTPTSVATAGPGWPLCSGISVKSRALTCVSNVYRRREGYDPEGRVEQEARKFGLTAGIVDRRVQYCQNKRV